MISANIAYLDSHTNKIMNLRDQKKPPTISSRTNNFALLYSPKHLLTVPKTPKKLTKPLPPFLNNFRFQFTKTVPVIPEKSAGEVPGAPKVSRAGPPTCPDRTRGMEAILYPNGVGRKGKKECKRPKGAAALHNQIPRRCSRMRSTLMPATGRRGSTRGGRDAGLSGGRAYPLGTRGLRKMHFLPGRCCLWPGHKGFQQPPLAEFRE